MTTVFRLTSRLALGDITLLNIAGEPMVLVRGLPSLREQGSIPSARPILFALETFRDEVGSCKAEKQVRFLTGAPF